MDENKVIILEHLFLNEKNLLPLPNFKREI